MKKILLLNLIAVCFSIAANNLEKVYTLKHSSEPIKIDGIIDPVWNTAD